MDIEKTIQFILDMQAKHEAALQRTDERIKTLVDVSLSLAHNLETLSQETDRRFRETDQRFRETDERFRETEQRFRETDFKLNALIETVDKLVRRNGASTGGEK